MTKLVIDKGAANVALSDVAVLQLYLAGSEYVTVLKHDIDYQPPSLCRSISM